MNVESFFKRALSKAHRLTLITLLLTHGVWALPVVLTIRMIRPWRTIRFGTIRSDRIGHFAADAGHQLNGLQLQDKQFIDLYWLPRKTCNKFFARLVCRHLFVYWWVQPLDCWNRLIPGGGNHWRPSTTTKSRDINGYLEKSKTFFTFLPEEDEKGKEWLRNRGWQDGEQFVCLLVRDSAYLDHSFKQKEGGWRYHDFRDSDISDYESAATWLADKGVWVLRMGKIMANPLKIKHRRIIDYSFELDKSDFLDVWLFANCKFCISTGCGPDAISDIYRRPLLLLNYIPLRDIFSWSNAIHFPKHLFWKSSGKHLNLSDYIKHSYLSSDEYHRAEIIVKDLTPEIILEAVQEMLSRLDGTWNDSEDDLERHELLWQTLRECPDYRKYHDFINLEARVGSNWFRSIERNYFVCA